MCVCMVGGYVIAYHTETYARLSYQEYVSHLSMYVRSKQLDEFKELTQQNEGIYIFK